MSIFSRERGPFQGLVDDLQARNSATDRMLGMVFGRGRNRTILLPTPGERVKDGRVVADEFLAVTPYKLSVVRVDRNGALSAGTISKLIEGWLGKKHTFLSRNYEHRGDELILDGSLHVNTDHTNDLRGVDWTDPPSYGTRFVNCRLVDVDPTTAQQIIRLNGARVHSLREANQNLRAEVQPI